MLTISLSVVLNSNAHHTVFSNVSFNAFDEEKQKVQERNATRYE